MPIVRLLTIVMWRGRNEIRPPRDADREREQQRVRRLRDEQVRDPLDVRDHAPALGDDAGHASRTCRRAAPPARRHASRRARAHGHTDVGVLQRQRVVHAVAGHRDDVPAPLERRHHRPLLLRRDPPEHRVVLEHVGSSSRSSGSSRRRTDRRPRRYRRGRRPHRRCAGCRRRSPCSARPARRSRRACRRHRAAPAPRTPPARTRVQPAGSSSPASCSSLRASSTTRWPLAASRRRAHAPGHRSAPSHTISGAPITHVP